MNRWPMWYSISNPLWYPHFMPYGIFGPPALLGWDIWNDWKGVVCNNQTVILLNRKGITQQTINLPALPIGGLVWDWDNKICKLRLRNIPRGIRANPYLGIWCDYVGAKGLEEQLWPFGGVDLRVEISALL